MASPTSSVPTMSIHYRMPADLRAEVEDVAVQERRSLTQQITYFLRQAVDRAAEQRHERQRERQD